MSVRHDGTSSIADWYGGALRTTEVDLELDRLTIAGNSAFEGGGGIAVFGASLLVTSSRITGTPPAPMVPAPEPVVACPRA